MRPILKKYLASISKVKAEQPNPQRELSREDIASTMRQWISEGKMFSSAMLKKWVSARTRLDVDVHQGNFSALDKARLSLQKKS